MVAITLDICSCDNREGNSETHRLSEEDENKTHKENHDMENKIEQMENKIEQMEKIYKAVLETVANESGAAVDLNITLSGMALAVATIMATYEGEYPDDITIDMMAEDFKKRIVRSYNSIRRIE